MNSFNDLIAYALDSSIPVLETEKVPVGPTHYLDSINPEDITDSLMRGVDRLGRNFILAHCRDEEGREGTLVFFKRYTDDSPVWTVAQNHKEEYVGGWINTAYSDGLADTLELIRSGSVKHTDDIYGERTLTLEKPKKAVAA